jgi:hypothetical protein
MKILITKEQSLFLRRRLYEIDDLIKSALNNVNPDDYNMDEYVTEIVWQIIDHYGDVTNNGKIEELSNYIRRKYTNDIRDYYYHNKKY